MKGTSEYVIPVPGSFTEGIAYLDLETEKVPADDATRDRSQFGGFWMKNGELLRRRWSIVMYGVALTGEIHLSCNLTEKANLFGLGDLLYRSNEVVYAATRQFDEMIAKGRFTNARRAHEDTPFFPAVLGAEDMRWRNLGPIPDDIRKLRGEDLPSKGISQQIAQNWEGVAIHLMRDVVSLILMDGDPDQECRQWCRRVMRSGSFALAEITEGE